MNLILMGAPAAGKDTLVENLVKIYNFDIITPGEIYRREAENNTTIGIEAKKYWAQGKLCPDEMTNNLIKNAIYISNKNKIFNGFPRTLNQAKFLDSCVNIKIVIDLIIDFEIAKNRLLSRGRIDDADNIIKVRFEDYIKNNKDIVEYYKNKNIYFTINSDNDKENVFKLAQDIINDYL